MLFKILQICCTGSFWLQESTSPRVSVRGTLSFVISEWCYNLPWAHSVYHAFVHVNYLPCDRELFLLVSLALGVQRPHPCTNTAAWSLSVSVVTCRKKYAHVCKWWFAYEWAFQSRLTEHRSYSGIQARPRDRGTSHGNVKHDYSRRDNMCNNNRISWPRAGCRAAGDPVSWWWSLCRCSCLARQRVEVFPHKPQTSDWVIVIACGNV